MTTPSPPPSASDWKSAWPALALVVALLWPQSPAALPADADRLAEPPAAAKPPRAARSVHLGWTAPPGEIFYNEMVVERSVAGSYFMGNTPPTCQAPNPDISSCR